MGLLGKLRELSLSITQDCTGTHSRERLIPKGFAIVAFVKWSELQEDSQGIQEVFKRIISVETMSAWSKRDRKRTK